MTDREKVISILSKYINFSFGDKDKKVMVDEIIALLKEQEAVKPISCKSYIHTEPITFDYECPICMTGIIRNICGQAVKWDD